MVSELLHSISNMGTTRVFEVEITTTERKKNVLRNRYIFSIAKCGGSLMSSVG